MCYQSLLSSSYIVPTSTSIPKFTISFLTSRTTLRINLAFKQFHTPTFHNNSAASAMVKPQFNAGDKVEYKPVGGRDSNTSSSTGIIERVLMEDTQAGSTGVTVHANPEHPRYEIRNVKTGKSSAVKEENILKTI